MKTEASTGSAWTVLVQMFREYSQRYSTVLFPESRVSIWLFIRMLGLINFIAFTSFFAQVDGLIGSKGIIPAADFLQQVKVYQGNKAQWILPSICWVNASDEFLRGLCLVGMIAAACVTIGFAPWLFLLICWVNYLSLTGVGQSFFSFQWDVLLLEVNLCALLLIPLTSLRLRGPKHTRYHRAGLLLLYLLLFKLMFSSGMVKIASEDPTWADLTAMEYHYETQPLPLPAAWHVHKLPPDIQKASTFSMFIIELLLPLCIFLPRTFRRVAASGFILLQILILFTGNYCFFNWLTIALCLLLIDDQAWRRIGRINTYLSDFRDFTIPAPIKRIRRYIAWPTTALLALLMLTQTATSSMRKQMTPAPLLAIQKGIAPFRSSNGYGLFAIMTTTRPEIILEGSHDGVTWKAYEFKYKPGDLHQRPRLVAPHQPRLDWQFWFAALAWDYPQPWRSQPWMFPFVERLLEGEPVVLDLLAHNPFPDQPPRFIRANTYDYQFSSREERRDNGTWWTREFIKPYFPEISLRGQ